MEKLKSGETYKITDLFTDKRHIIIPDLQRDYCWGDKKHGDNNIELVSGFLDSLFSIFKENQNKSIKLGMIYAYEYPKDSERIYLCDGQQRITTLYLLLGMLYRETKNEAVKKCLISEIELQDDQEPRLQYAIRESTLYFLSDLVCNFFLENNETKVFEIKKQSWYFKEYNLDPTIQSMLLALEIIENKLGLFENKKSLSDFLLNNIEFFYFEMIDREAGEDMFVVINTTGEPLTPTESIKPILIGNIDNLQSQKNASDLWEKWEKWFWNNKSASEHEADQGLNAFFVYYWQIKLLQEKQWKGKNSFPLNPIQLFSKNSEIESNEESNTVILVEELNKAKSIDEIEKYFFAYQNLFEDFKNEDNQKVLKSIKSLDFKSANFLREIPINIILPLIEFKIKYSEESINSFLRRLRKNYFDEQRNERKENYIDWRHLVQLVDKSKNIDDLFCFTDDSNFKNISNVPNNIKNWYNIEEQLKSELKKENKVIIENIEDHQDFMGDLSFLFQVFLKKYLGNKNDFSSLNVDLNDIQLSIFDFEYLKTKKSIDIEYCFNLYNELISNKLLSVLEIRFNRLNHLWSGTWSLSREYFQYGRWHKKNKELIYQNWFYFVMGELLNNEITIESLLKEYLKTIFYQSSKKFFETDLCIEKTIDFEQFKMNLENKSNSENNNGFYHWNGFLWYYLLAINEPEKNIDFEIVFDLFDRENNSFKLGNQFIWSKGYYDKTIKTYDSFGDVNWNEWRKIEKKEPHIKEDFINKRELKIKELFESSLV
ncbi:DUF262 domain-containing protein [Flavobacterium sp. N3904]|uniref:DUF262 domain-containing protein n=1 Tax=Flavobacterium sp. N3904 TaxID=2986835 RepID=UPI0022241A40|nr:DUF262 domain-containing protein [Flavobacterium sp. N3904]